MQYTLPPRLAMQIASTSLSCTNTESVYPGCAGMVGPPQHITCVGVPYYGTLRYAECPAFSRMSSTSNGSPDPHLLGACSRYSVQPHTSLCRCLNIVHTHYLRVPSSTRVPVSRQNEWCSVLRVPGYAECPGCSVLRELELLARTNT